jgi:hypothetical protein
MWCYVSKSSAVVPPEATPTVRQSCFCR